MKYYKADTGEVFAFELDGSQDDFIPPVLTLMTAQEVEAHRNPPPPVPTAAEIGAALTNGLNAHLDAVAGHRRYDSRFTCSLRAGFPGPFQEEGRVFAAWMDACNMAAYQLMAAVKAGRREVPTEAELVAAMPVIEWPPSPIPAGAA